MREGRIEQNLSRFVPEVNPNTLTERQLEEIKPLDDERLDLENRLSDIEGVLRALQSAPKKEQNGRKIAAYQAEVERLKRTISDLVKQLKNLGASWL
jgi:hypothetical protein